jgi:hypothetical protein
MLIARDPNRRGDVIASRLKQFHDNMIRTVCGIKALAEDSDHAHVSAGRETPLSR